ncbi:MAG: cyclase/dehydrase [Catenulispora sp.]|nr:cyclase/dehydrase [Catenulispora sp.]
MSDVKTSVDVRAPIRTAYNQWTDFESFPQFMSGVLEVRQLDDRHTHWVTEVAGARREFDAEIVERLPDERIAWRSIGEVRHSGLVTFEPLGDSRTRVTVDLAWQPDGLLEKAGSAIGLDRLQIKADLERFRRFVERHDADADADTAADLKARQPAEPQATTPAPPDGARLAGTSPTPAGAQAPDKHGHSDDDVVDVLLAQHAQIKDLMTRTSAAEGEDKQRLFTELTTQLKLHEKGEQRVVHPVTRTRVEDGARTADLRLGEEARADQLIAEMADMAPDSGEFDASLAKLRKDVLAHAEHEERTEFPKLRRELSTARLRTMAEELVAAQTAQN